MRFWILIPNVDNAALPKRLKEEYSPKIELAGKPGGAAAAMLKSVLYLFSSRRARGVFHSNYFHLRRCTESKAERKDLK